MDLISIDDTNVISMMQATRPAGQLYAPEAVVRLRDRYQFAKIPALEDLGKTSQEFSIGKFRDAEIREFNLYNDGIIVKSRSNSSLIDAFLEDLLEFANKELGIVILNFPKPERHYESAIVVHSDFDIVGNLAPKVSIADHVTKALNRAGYSPAKFQSSAFIADVEIDGHAGRRKPIHFSIERRIGIPYADGVFFSVAPLKTDDHLRLLRDLEGAARDLG